MIAGVLALDSAGWSAIAEWVLVGLAAAAGFIAFRQLAETARTRREQAQPYVAVYIAETEGSRSAFDFVVRNFGATAAYNVRLYVTPAPEMAGGPGGSHPIELPEVIPVLVPGQEWRTFWDTDFARVQSGKLRDSRHEARVTFEASPAGRRRFELKYILDWGPIVRRDVLTVRGVHDAAEALRGIHGLLKGWHEPGAGLRVVARDGDRRDEWARQRREERHPDQ